MGTVVERLELLISASSKGAVAGLKEAEVGTGALDQKAQGLTGVLQKLGLQGQVSGGVMAAGIAGGAALAGAGLLKFALQAADTFVEATAGVRAFQRVTGATAEDSSKLVAAMTRLGISADQGNTAFFQLTKRIGTGKDTLSDYGVEVARAKDGTLNTSETLLRAADAFSQMNDQGEKSAFVFENFGRGGAALIPLLQQGRQGLQDFFAIADKHHQIFSQDDLDKARDYTRAQRDMNTALQGIAIEVGRALIPALTQAAHTVTQLTEAFDGLGKAVGYVNEQSHGLFKQLTIDLIPGLGGGAGPLIDKTGKATQDMGADFAKAAEQAQKLATAADELAKAQDHLLQISRAAQGGTLALESAQIAYEKAVNDSTDAVNTYGADSLEARDADLARRQAAVALGSAQLDQYNTQTDLTGSVLNNTQATKNDLAVIDAAIAKYGDQSGALTDLKNRILDIPGYKSTTIAIAFDLSRASPEALAQAAGLDLPSFDSGGMVGGPLGAPQLIIAHGGETVVPVGGSSSGGPMVANLILDGHVAATAVFSAANRSGGPKLSTNAISR